MTPAPARSLLALVPPPRLRGAALACLLGASAVGCEAPPPEPTPDARSTAAAAKPAATREEKASRAPKARPKRKITAKPVAEVPVSPDDPEKGEWTLAEATQGLTGDGPLTATITTSLGKLECKLFEDKAPITVANFVGLARGLRPWKNKEGEWVKKPAYDDTKFHRIIKGFMIQGGSQNGSEEAGYVIPDEIWDDANHDRAGLLCMANRGKNTNSKQFFITHDAALHLDGGYTIFGECGPHAVLDELASVQTRGERPVDPPTIESITIARGGAAALAASAEPGASAAPAAGSAAPSASAAPAASAAPSAPPTKAK
jgi:peptidyl-prolyl cis-trans isomerase A (cyclophilin A)